MIVVYGYICELFFGWYGGAEYELYLVQNRLSGPLSWAFWSLIFCNGVAPQLMWFKRMRQNLTVVFIVSLIVSVGMWLERYVIIVGSLERDYLPSSWHFFYPTIWDFSLYIGTIGFFFTLIFLFIRLLPMINIFEMQALQYHEGEFAGPGQPVAETK